MNRIILITGANRGLGLEIARQLARLEQTVILTSRNKLNGMAAVEMLAKENLKTQYLQLDVTNATQRIELRKEIEARFGKLDVLINNAGISIKRDRALTNLNDEVWQKTLETNSEAPLKLSLVLAPIMPSGSRIINISSGGGSMSDPVGGWSPVYCISKSALNAITRHLAYHLSQVGISVNAVCPGWVKTDMGSMSAPRSVEEGADTAVWLSTSDEKSTGKFYRDRREIKW